jgi:hypothetical protein
MSGPVNISALRNEDRLNTDQRRVKMIYLMFNYIGIFKGEVNDLLLRFIKGNTKWNQ